MAVFVLLCTSESASQPYWAKDVGGLGNDHVADVKVDTDGSIYMTGEFGGTMTFGGQTYTSAGSIDAFVARLNPAGEVQWFRTWGGGGIDRGFKVALGTGTVLAVAGEFLGTATFQSQTLTSVAGTADMFVAVVNKADGQLQWIRQGGGGTGTDRPYGVSVGADGQVSVAGEFRGAASWSATTITSATNPGTGTPDADVFIATYSPVGDMEWLQQGRAGFADRAIDLVHGPGGELYVTGQFSDTITFDQQHANTLMNATFLMRFDAAGNEVWFRRMGGAGFNHVRDMVLKPDGRLAVVGDVQGTMIYFGGSQTNVVSGEAYAYYLLDVDQGGALLGHTTTGSTDGVSVAGLSVQGNDLAVIGQFDCHFTDLGALYGDGVFMAVGAEDLFVSRHQTNGLSLLEAQQFGGRSGKSAGAIAHLSNGELVFSGSYQGNLIFPAEPGMQADITTANGLEGNGVGTYCGDDDYGYFVANTSAALTDGFIARGYVEEREPYDWWRRTDGDCDLVELDPCIGLVNGNDCPETIRACGSVLLSVDLKFSSTPGQTGNFLGPMVSYLWSSGSTAPTIGVVTTGTYWVQISSVNGCWQWTDTIEVTIDPAPQIPLISDDVVLNQGANVTQTIEMCDPETHWVWTPNGSSGGSVYWTAPDGTQVPGDSVVVDTTGVYTVVRVSSNGCVRQNTINVVDHPTITLPDLLADLAISFPDDSDGNDTLALCPGGSLEFTYVPTWTINGVVGELPEGLSVDWGFQLPPPNEGDGGPQSTQLTPTETGWLVQQLVVMVSNEPCGADSIIFYETDSIYVDLYPVIDTEVTLTGPTILCDGDSGFIVATCTACQGLDWNGQGFTLIAPDTIRIDSAGTYGVEGYAEDANGCSFSSQAAISVITPAGQVLSVTPGDGIICPGSSATLSTTTTGTGHVWYGPQGPITGQGSSLATTVPGDYYLVMVVSGCNVTSNSATLVNYGTPFLDAAPRPVLCSLDDEVELQVVATAGSIIEWQAPLTGTTITQAIDQPGTYFCSVTACGITTQLSIAIGLSIVEVELATPGPYTLCDGDSVLLQGSSDQPNLTWMPSGAGAAVWVSTTGAYYLIAEDDQGCADSTAVVQVTAITFPEPVTALGDTVCTGDTVQLSATGSGNIAWYADEAAEQLLGTGSTLSYVPASSTVVYVAQSESGCSGSIAGVPIQLLPRPASLNITGPAVVCEGEAFEVSVDAADSVTIAWSTPVGAFTVPSISVAVAELDDSGIYRCVAQYDGCMSPAASWRVDVFAPEPMDLPDEAFLCTGGAVTVSVPASFSDVQWSNGLVANSISITTGQELSVQATDQHGCAAASALVLIEEDCELIIPNVFTPNGDGANESWLPTGGFVSADTRIFNRWGDVVFQGDMVQRAWNGKHYANVSLCSEGVYYYVIHLKRSDGTAREVSGYVQLIR